MLPPKCRFKSRHLGLVEFLRADTDADTPPLAQSPPRDCFTPNGRKQRCNLEMAGQRAVEQAKRRHSEKLREAEKKRLGLEWRAHRAKRAVLSSVSKNASWLQRHMGDAPARPNSGNAKREDTGDVPTSCPSTEMTPSSSSSDVPDALVARRLSVNAKVESSIQAAVNRNRRRDSRIITGKDEWKRFNKVAADAKIFSVIGGYPDLKDALRRRGWVENTVPESRCYDFRWSLKASDIDFEHLDEGQVVNHFVKNREITTKVGLTLNLRANSVDADSYYPRSFHISCPLDKGDFLLDYIATKAQAVLVNFHNECTRLDGVQSETYSEEIIRLCLDMCKRSLQDIHDVIDNPSLSNTAWSVLPQEWELLKKVCLDNPAVWEDEDPDCIVMDFLEQLKITHGLSKPKKEKYGKEDKKKKDSKTKNSKVAANPVPQKMPYFMNETNVGKHLARETHWVVHELSMKESGGPKAWRSLQCGRNAWIIKPAAASRGRGIQMMRNLSQILKATDGEDSQWICQKYLENPQLIHGYKFDIRQWVLVTDWNPLTVYLWKQPYVRFAGVKYDGNLQDTTDVMHLVNNSVVKNAKTFSDYNSDLDTSGYMWFYQTYQKWLHETYCAEDLHHSPFIHEPPYTCEKFDVKWEKVRFTAPADEDDAEDQAADSGEEQKAGEPKADDEPSANTEPSAGGEIEEKEEIAAEPKSEDIASSEEIANSEEEPAGDETSNRECGDAECDEESGAEKCTDGPPVADAPGCAKPPATASCPCAENPDVSPCGDIWNDVIVPQMEDIILWSLASVQDTVEHRKASCELYGYDFMVSDDRDSKVWLTEVNSSPAMDYSTRVTTPLVKQVMEETCRILIDNAPETSTEWTRMRLGPHVPARPRIPVGSMEILGVRCPSKKMPKKKKKKLTETPTESTTVTPSGTPKCVPPVVPKKKKKKKKESVA